MKKIVTLLKTLLIVSTVLVSFQLYAASLSKPLKLTLTDAIMLAMRQNPNVQSGEIQRVIDKFNLRAAQYEFEPQLSVDGSSSYDTDSNAQNYTLGPKVSITNSIGTTFSISADQAFDKEPGSDISDGVNTTFTIMQPLIKGFGRDVTLAALHNAYDAEKTNKLKLKKTVISAISAVVTDYRTLIQNQNDLITAQGALKRAQLTVTKDRALIKAGRMAKSDLGQAIENVQSTRIDLLTAENTLDKQRLKLLEDIGLNPKTNIVIDDDVSLQKMQLPSEQQSIDLALANNPDYITAVIGIGTLKRAVITSEDADKPELDLTLSRTRSTGLDDTTNAATGATTTGRPVVSVGLKLTAPIGNVKNESGIVGAKIALEQAEISLNESKRKLIEQVLDARRQVEISWQQALVAQEKVATAKENEEIALKKQSYGLISQFELLSLQNAYTEAEKQATQTKIAYLNNVTAFRAFLGTLVSDWGFEIRY